MTDPLPRLIAALADRYRLERELGAGGMATVYLAQDLKHQRKVALKVLHPELAAALGSDRFLAEIRTTANLQHPNIVPLFDSGEADGFVYYVNYPNLTEVDAFLESLWPEPEFQALMAELKPRWEALIEWERGLPA